MPKIVLYPNDILRKKAEEVVGLDVKTKKEIDSLIKFLFDSGDGAGLAAPQIGISKRFLGIKDRETKEIKVYVNPKIDKVYGDKSFFTIETDGEIEDFLEGCLSFPFLFGAVKRWGRIDMSWLEVNRGKLVNKKAELKGFRAIVIQHEIDHLDGVLFIDHVKKNKGKFCKAIEGEMVKWSVDDVLGLE